MSSRTGRTFPESAPGRRRGRTVLAAFGLLAGVFLLATLALSSAWTNGRPGPRAANSSPGPSRVAAAPASADRSPAATPSSPVQTPAAAFGARTPTRVVIESLHVDLPVVAPAAGETFPLCGVAEYLPSLSRPGFPGATYLYAHARAGMFLPLLEASLGDPAKLRNLAVEVFTDDDLAFSYRVSEVRRKQSPSPRSLTDALLATSQQLWLQTSEGPAVSSSKLIVIALPDRPPVAASAADAHPQPHPLACH